MQKCKFSYSQRDAHKFMGIVRASPFTDVIQRAVVPSKVHLPKLNNYDGTGFTKAHIVHVRTLICLITGSTSILCKVFASTFTVQATWFANLKSGSINSFDKLCNNFLNYFCYDAHVKNLISLFKGERLVEYVKRFQKELSELELEEETTMVIIPLVKA